MKVVLNNVTPVGFEKQGKISLILEDGTITSISKEPFETTHSDTEIKDCYIAPGFVDIGCTSGEPGFEDKETFSSLAAGAQKAGFTHLALFPNTTPPLQHKSDLSFVKHSTAELACNFHVLAALTKSLEGQEMNELIDLAKSGAKGFSDGLNTIKNPKLLSLALEYSQAVNKVLVHHPCDYQFNANGLMHEGIVSTQIGMRGIPAFAEELLVQRDLSILEYSGGKLHLYGLSTKKSVQLVREAKARGLDVSCSVNVMNLAFLDEDCLGFDTNYKVIPPLRDKHHQAHLWQGLEDGTIDCITSGHIPLSEEDKNLEFQYAEFGAATLELSSALAYQSTKNILNLEQFIDKISIVPRKILSLANPQLEEGVLADFVLFDFNNPIKSPKATKGYNLLQLRQDIPFSIKGTITKGITSIF